MTIDECQGYMDRIWWQCGLFGGTIYTLFGSVSLELRAAPPLHR